MLLRDTIDTFAFGQIDTIEAKKIPKGSASSALNWLNFGDRIELRRGYLLKGTDDGAGKVTSLHVGTKADGTEVLWKSYLRKVKYFSETTLDWVEIGTDILPAIASGEDLSFDNYASLAGNQSFFSSPNSGFYKLMTANPGSYTDLTDASKNFLGRLKIFFNRVILWGRIADQTGIYGSYIDTANYTTVSAEAVATGNGSTAHYTGSLAFRLTSIGDATTQFDITNPSGTTFRYTWDTTGTDPSITAANLPIGFTIVIAAQNFTAANNGAFIVTGSGSNYFEVTNASGVAENNKTIGTGTIKKGNTRTAFGVAIKVGGVVTLTDDYNGNLKDSNQVTRGTINYTTGAYDITFASNIGNAVAITADYQWENSNNNGLGDFTKSSPRTAGQGFVFRQDDGGGKAQSVGLYGDVLYCLHALRTWALAITTTDTSATNLPYRDRVGLPNHRAKVDTGNGIYYIDDTDKTDPQFRLLTLQQLSGLVIPTSISKRVTRKGVLFGIDLSGYEFDNAAMIEWGDFIITACRTSDSLVNNRIFTFNKNTAAFNWHDYYVSCFAIYNGILLAGDSATNNVYELFSGFDDDDSLITSNYYETELSNMEVVEMKKCKKLGLQGLIAPDQSYDVYISTDNGDFTQIGSVEGSGSYVDSNSGVTIGSQMIGQDLMGGGGDGITAYNYETQINLRLDRFERAKLRFVATGIGYVSINQYQWYDIKRKGKKIPRKYR